MNRLVELQEMTFEQRIYFFSSLSIIGMTETEKNSFFGDEIKEADEGEIRVHHDDADGLSEQARELYWDLISSGPF